MPVDLKHNILVSHHSKAGLREQSEVKGDSWKMTEQELFFFLNIQLDECMENEEYSLAHSCESEL